MLIENIRQPADIKKFSADQLETLADELRRLIIERVSLNGGHLASNLGVVELTLALHYVFDSPADKLIWDVGHQCYSHKLLTGRYDRFHTLRTHGGLSGFPKPDESPHDIFGAGHSSTSISAAVGIVEGRDRHRESFKVIAVIGDGALTSGLAYEGLNHAGHLKKDLIVILNDNNMSISENVGAISNYLSKVQTGSFYKKFKKETKAILGGIPKIGESMAKIAERAEGSLKGFFLPGGLFVDLGFNYIGPMDGHDIPLLIEMLKGLKDSTGPTLVHIITKKGKGYKFSEEDPCIYHGIGPFTVETGEPRGQKASAPGEKSGKPDTEHDTCLSYCDTFGAVITELAAEDERIVVITAAMKEGTGLSPFAERFPDRIYDVGIAEPHAVTFAAGLATQGLRPVVAIYSTFLQRSYDEIIHDVCLQNLPVVFAIDRAGVVGEDGATHQGLFDISFLRPVPGLVFMAPADNRELKAMFRLALRHEGPVAIRYPRGKIHLARLMHERELNLELGRAEILKEGKDLCIIAVGNTIFPSITAAGMLKEKRIDAGVVNARFLKPLDEKMIERCARTTGHLLTVEENVLAGGFGSAVLECLNRNAIESVRVLRLGIGDRFLEHGSQTVLRAKYGLDHDGIYAAALELIGS